jgi:F-type H+-transporting ATPase subunit b
MTASFFNLNATFAVELVVFFVVLAVLARFVIRPLQTAMHRRQEQIDESMAKAGRVEELLVAAEADYQAQLVEARRQARKIIDTALQIAEHTAHEGRHTRPGHPAVDGADRRFELEAGRS